MIKGGSIPNCIPDRCSFIVDIRVVTSNDMEKTENLVNKIVCENYVKRTVSTIKDISRRPSMEKNADIVRLFESLSSVSTGYNPGELVPVESGGGSDLVYTQLAGVPSIWGLSGSGNYCHTAREYISIDKIAKRIKLLSVFCIWNW